MTGMQEDVCKDIQQQQQQQRQQQPAAAIISLTTLTRSSMNTPPNGVVTGDVTRIMNRNHERITGGVSHSQSRTPLKSQRSFRKNKLGDWEVEGTDTSHNTNGNDNDNDNTMTPQISATITPAPTTKPLERKASRLIRRSHINNNNNTKSSSSSSSSSLNIHDLPMIGRDQEMDQLRTIVDTALANLHSSKRQHSRQRQRQKQTQPTLVSITGRSGTGKSLLLKSLRDYVVAAATTTTRAERCYVCMGKFDMNQRVEPYTAISTAMGDLVSQVILHKKRQGQQHGQQHGQGLDDIKTEFTRVVGTDGANLLVNAIPSLGKLFLSNNSNNTNNNNSNNNATALEGDRIENSLYQLRYLFRKLIRAICHDNNTITNNNNTNNNNNKMLLIMMLDDVQWADPSTLQLLDALVTDTDPDINNNNNAGHFLLFTSGRDNEMLDDTNAFCLQLESWTSTSTSTSRMTLPIHIQEIHLDNLHPNQTANMIRSLLGMPMSTSNDNHDDDDPKLDKLIKAVYTKTHGNPLFLIHFLDYLVLMKHITRQETSSSCPSSSTCPWTWNDTTIEQVFPKSENCLGLLQAKLGQLQQLSSSSSSSSSLIALQVASCLGPRFHENTLSVVMDHVRRKAVFGDMLEQQDNVNDNLSPSEATAQWLQHPIAMGLVVRHGKKRYAFCHDDIAAAAFSMIARDTRLWVKLRVGERLLEDASETGSEERMYLGVNLCNDARTMLQGRDLIGLASVQLLAARRALRKAAFFIAINAAEAGLLCLGRRGWANNNNNNNSNNSNNSYQVWVELMTVLAEASFCVGQHATCRATVLRIIAALGPLEDKIRAYRIEIKALHMRGLYGDATSMGLFVLKELGVAKLSENPSSYAVASEWNKTKRLLKQHLNGSNLNSNSNNQNQNQSLATSLPLLLVGDPLIHGMKIVELLLKVTESSNPNLFQLLTLHAVRWSIKYGLSDVSPIAFSAYAVLNMTMTVGTDPRLALDMGELALALCQRLQSKASLTAVTCRIYSRIHHWVHDMRVSLQPLLYAHQFGLESGNVDSAMECMASYCQAQFVIAAIPLPTLETLLERHIQECREYRQTNLHSYDYNNNYNNSYSNNYNYSNMSTIPFSNCLLQTVYNLQTKCEDALELTGHAMNQAEVLKQASLDGSQKNRNTRVLKVVIDSFRLQIACMMGAFERAGELSEATQDYSRLAPGGVGVVRNTFYRGLTAVILATNGVQVRKNKTLALQSIKSLEEWHVKGHVNSLHLIHILKAEMSKLTAGYQRNETQAKYEEALESTARYGFQQDWALIQERVGRFYLETPQPSTTTTTTSSSFATAGQQQQQQQQQTPALAAKHLAAAVQAYSDWGAHLCARKLMMEFSGILMQTKVVDPMVPTTTLVSASTAATQQESAPTLDVSVVETRQVHGKKNMPWNDEVVVRFVSRNRSFC